MKQYIVIGCGRFGYSLAVTMAQLGNQVMAIDKNEEIIHSIADKVTHAAIVDVSDEKSMRGLGLSNFDVAIVAIGSDIKSSIMATIMAKEMGVKFVVCKASDDIQAKVLKKLGADRVVRPEKDMGVKVAHSLVSENILDHIELSDEYNIYEVAAPEKWIGKSLIDIDLRKNHNVTVIAIRQGERIDITPDPKAPINSGDVMVIIGRKEFAKYIETLV